MAPSPARRGEFEAVDRASFGLGIETVTASLDRQRLSEKYDVGILELFSIAGVRLRPVAPSNEATVMGTGMTLGLGPSSNSTPLNHVTHLSDQSCYS